MAHFCPASVPWTNLNDQIVWQSICLKSSLEILIIALAIRVGARSRRLAGSESNQLTIFVCECVY